MTLALEGFDTAPAQDNSPAVDPVKTTNVMSFQNDVMTGSLKGPVLAYFTASWCGPCKQLGPALEKLVRSYKGKVTLAKIDIDQSPQLAQALQVQSVPMVFAFIAGQPVDAFMGALPESQLKAFIDRILKMAGINDGDDNQDNSDDPLAPALAALTDGNIIAAQEHLQAILSADAKNARAQAGLELAKELLTSAIPGQAEKLAGQVESSPKDAQLRYDYANALLAAGQFDASVEQLLESIRLNRTLNEEAARLRLLKIFDLLGNDNDLVLSSRRRLSSILFS